MAIGLPVALRSLGSINYATVAVKEVAAVHELLDIFHDSLTIQEDQTSIALLTPTQKGQTAVTFKCKLLNYKDLSEKLKTIEKKCEQINLEEEVKKIIKLQKKLQEPQNSTDDLQPFAKFVTKWQSQELSQNELLCTHVFKLLNINTPDIKLYSGELCGKLKDVQQISEKFKERKLEDEDLVIDDFIIQFMPTLDARTFESLFTRNPEELLEFTTHEWNQMMEEFGKIALIDLFIGNDDRLFDIEIDKEDVEEMLKHYFNAGNIMFFRPYQGATRILNKVYAIDCTTSNWLHKHLDQVLSSDEESDEDPVIDTTALNSSGEWGAYSDEDNVESDQKKIEDQDVEIGSDNEISFSESDETIVKLHNVFKHFSKNENIAAFAGTIAKSVKKFIDTAYDEYKQKVTLDEALDEKINALKKETLAGIKTGCLAMLESLKSLDLSQIPLSQECLNSPLNLAAMKLMKMNLKFIKEA